jgi:hypothetical protein
MNGKKWLILLVSLVVVLLVSGVGVTSSSFVDLETSNGNTLQAWTSTQWVQTTQSDFEAGVLNNVDTSSSPEDVILAQVGWGSYSPELLINPGAETSDTTGWTAEGSNTGNFVAGFDSPRGYAAPHSGSYCFFWNRPSASDDWAYQEIDLSAYLGKIQAGEAQIRAGGWLICSEYHVPVWDIVRLKVILYDAGHTEINTIYDTGELNIQNWTEYLIEDYDLPTNTKYVRLYFQTYEPNWDAGNADDLTVKIRVKEYYPSGIFASQILDTGVAGASWDALFWDETLPSNTDITFEVRASDTLFAKDATTPSWISVGGTSPVTSGLPSGRYMQWRATLTTSDTSQTPTLHEVRVYHY